VMRTSVIERVAGYMAANPRLRSEHSRQLLAKLAIDTEVGRLMNYRVAWLHDKGLPADWPAAMAKLHTTELYKRAASTAMQLLGLYGQLDKKDAMAPLQGWIEQLYLVSYGGTIAAGTSEIQRNIIALRGLGLPRS